MAGTVLYHDARRFWSWPGLMAMGFLALALVSVAVPGMRQVIEHNRGESVFAPSPAHFLKVAGDADGQFLIDASYSSPKVSGHTARTMIDTGAWSVTLNRRTAKALGYDLKHVKWDGAVSTVIGTIRTSSIRLRSLRLGPSFEVNDVPAIILDSDTFDCLIGMSLLRHYRVAAAHDEITISD
jgi:clan AA aspartic protease (TIGR02281 family)